MSEGLTENGRSRAKKVVRSSFLDGIKAGNKLYPMQAASYPNFAFWGVICLSQNWFKCQNHMGGPGGDFGHEEPPHLVRATF